MIRRVNFEQAERIILADASDNEDFSDYEKSLRRRLLRSVIDDNLTKIQKCYIILYYKENKKVAEIAKQFGVLPSTVSRTINRARKNLYKAMTGRELYTRFSKD